MHEKLLEAILLFLKKGISCSSSPLKKAKMNLQLGAAYTDPCLLWSKFFKGIGLFAIPRPF